MDFLSSQPSAYYFGYIPWVPAYRTRERSPLFSRSSGIVATSNCYYTRTLRPLLPIYVSSVDSGNLVGHLLTLRPGLAALPDQPILAARWLEGLEDTFKTLLAAAPGIMPGAMIRFQQTLEATLAQRPSTLAAARRALEQLAADARNSWAAGIRTRFRTEAGTRAMRAIAAEILDDYPSRAAAEMAQDWHTDAARVAAQAGFMRGASRRNRAARAAGRRPGALD